MTYAEKDGTPIGDHQLHNQLLALLDEEEVDSELAMALLNSASHDLDSLDISIVHNLGMLAARIGSFEHAYAIAKISIEEGELATASAICLESGKLESPNEAYNFEDIIGEILRKGHISTKCDIFQEKMQSFGIIGRIVEKAYRVLSFPKVFFIAMKNPYDERISTIPGTKQRALEGRDKHTFNN